MKYWTKEQLENFFRHETMYSDETCKKLAAKLVKDGIVEKLIRFSPEDYTERVE